MSHSPAKLVVVRVDKEAEDNQRPTNLARFKFFTLEFNGRTLNFSIPECICTQWRLQTIVDRILARWIAEPGRPVGEKSEDE